MKNNLKTTGIVSLLVISGFLGLITFESEIVSAAGVTLYVDDDNAGSPTMDGSMLDPFDTIQKGIDNATGGDTVFVFNGTYNENVVVDQTINLTGEDRNITIIDGSGVGNVINVTASWTNITGFNITNGVIGIHVWPSSNNVSIRYNNITLNSLQGIYLETSNNNAIKINTILNNNNAGIYLMDSDDNNITENIVSFNNLAAAFEGGIFLDNSDWNWLEWNHVSNNPEYGVLFSGSSNNTLWHNDIIENCGGAAGLNVQSSDYNYIFHNNVSNSTGVGIQLYYSGHCVVFNNTVLGNSEALPDNPGLYVEQGDYNTLENNNIINNNYDGIYVSGSSFNDIMNNTIISNIYRGIFLESSDNITIYGNDILGNDGGNINLSLSNDNDISKNNISFSMAYGINITGSSGNLIFHNNIISNAVQAYDDTGNNTWNLTFPFGGNWWDDWTVPDINSDGFVDNPRVIPSGVSQDNRPFTTMDGWLLSNWFNKSSFPNYAPNGMPDFDQRQNDNWSVILPGIDGVLDTVPHPNDVTDGTSFIAPGMDLILDSLPAHLNDDVEFYYCGPAAAANSLWWLDSKFANHSGTPGDGLDEHSLVIDLSASDDHSAINVPPLIDDLALRFDTVSNSATNSSMMVTGIDQLLVDRNLDTFYQVYNVSWPNFPFVSQEITNCSNVILFLGFYDDTGTRVWGHIVTASGVDEVGQKIGISDPIINDENPIADWFAYNDAQNVSHDMYTVVSGPHGPPIGALPPESWFLLNYISGYGIPVNYAVVEEAVIVSPHSLPGAPIGLSAVDGATFVNLTWTTPYDGGSSITNYRIYRGLSSGGEAFYTEIGNPTFFNDTSVTGGTKYYYVVSAVNTIGESSLSNEVNGTPVSTPTAPTGLTAEIGDSYVNLSWGLPASAGGSPIIGYNIYRNGTTGIYNTTSAGQTWYNDTNVSNGLTYTYNVSAVNGVGEGPNSTVVAVPLTTPSAVVNLQAEEGIGYVNLTWEEPIDNGGSGITGYNIYRNGTAGVYASVPFGQNWYNDTTVINDITYTYNVSAVNSVGGSLNSTVIATPTSITVPSAPQNPQADAGDGFVNFSWEVPADNGGSPVTWYNVYRSGFSGVLANVTASQHWYNDTTVFNGFLYTYYVTANNSVGEGANSINVPATPTAPTVPSDPLNLQVDAGDEYLNLTWEGPLDNGGSGITAYNIYRNGTVGVYNTVIAPQLWFNDTNVINGIEYTYNVSAVNSVGEGPNSTGIGATPMTVPIAPQNLQATAGHGFVNLTWSEPADDGGSTITGYYIYRNGTAGVFQFIPAGRLWVNDTSVANGIIYTYNVLAVNIMGEGELSEDLSVTAGAAPSAPIDLTATPGASTVYLSWVAPALEGSFAITNYWIYKGTTSGEYDLPIVIGDILFYEDNLVTNGFIYYYQVRGVNMIGEGALSEEVNATPVSVPGAPTDLITTAGDLYINLTWGPPFNDGGSIVTNYRIYRSNTAGTEIFLDDVDVVFFYNDTDVENNVTYFFIITAVNGKGEGPFSYEVNATPSPPPVVLNLPPTCTLTTAIPGKPISGIFDLTGTALDNDGTVELVQIKVGKDGDWIDVNGTTSWDHKLDTTKLSNGKHTIYIRSYDGQNYSEEISMDIKVDNPPEQQDATIFLLIVIIIIMFIVLFLLIKKARGRPSDEFEEEEEEEEDEEEEDEPGEEEEEELE